VIVLIKTNFLFWQQKKKVCFDQYELDYLGRIKFLHVEMPYSGFSPAFKPNNAPSHRTSKYNEPY